MKVKEQGTKDQRTKGKKKQNQRERRENRKEKREKKREIRRITGDDASEDDRPCRRHDHRGRPFRLSWSERSP